MAPDEILRIRKERSQVFIESRIAKGFSKMQLHKYCGLCRVTIDKMESGGTWNIDSEIIYLDACLPFGEFEGFNSALRIKSNAEIL